MAKKFMLLLAAAAALALAIPSMASASGKLTEGGTLVPVGSSIVATGSDVTLTSNLLGAITCEKLTLKGTVTVNNGEEVAADGAVEVPGQTGCKNGTKAVKITITIVPHFHWGFPFVRFSFQFVIHIGTGESEIHCTYTGTEVQGEYTSGTGTFKFNSGAVVKGEPALCGTAKLSGSFALETENGTGLILD